MGSGVEATEQNFMLCKYQKRQMTSQEQIKGGSAIHSTEVEDICDVSFSLHSTGI